MSKKNLALLLFIAFGISLGCAISYYPQQQRLPSPSLEEPRRSARAMKREIQPAVEQSFVREKETLRYAGYHTDLFRSLFDSQPPLEQKSENQALSSQAPPIPLPASPPDPAPVLEPPLPGILTSITYLGQVSDGARSSVFLKEKERIFVVQAGEAFGKKKEFRLGEVTEKEIRIAMAHREDLIRIPLQKKKPLGVRPNASAPAKRIIPVPEFPLSAGADVTKIPSPPGGEG